MNNETLQFLLVETFQKRFMFSYPKGKRERGESTIKTAYRELYEETGLTDKDISLIPDKVYIEFLKDRPHIVYYLGWINEPEFPIHPKDKQEIKDFHWLTEKEISRMFTNFFYQRRQFAKQISVLFQPIFPKYREDFFNESREKKLIW